MNYPKGAAPLLMSQKNETPVLVLSLLITAGLLGAGFWLLMPRSPVSSNNPIISQTVSTNDRISQGERILVPVESRADNLSFVQEKQAGVAAIVAQQYDRAVPLLESALQKSRNSPETLIYLNNARIGTNKSYTIAVAVPVSADPNGSLEILRGVAQAQSEVNQTSGVKGVPLKVEIVSDDNNPEIAQQLANTLVQKPEVLGVVGHYASDVTLAAAGVYNTGGLVCISPVSTTVRLSGFGKYIFRTVPSDYIAAGALADYTVKTLQQKNVAVFFSSRSDYSQSLKSEFSRAIALAGGQVSGEYDLSAPDFSAATAIAQSLKLGVKALMLAPNTGTLDKALQVVQVNQRRMTLLAGDDVYAPKTLEVGGQQAVDMVISVPWHINGAPGSIFAKKSRSLWGGDVNWRTAISYDAVQALAAALQRNSTRSGVQQALMSSDFSATGAAEMVRFLPSGDRNVGIQLVKVSRGDRFGSGFDFVPVQR